MDINGFISFSICDDFNIIIKCGRFEDKDTYDVFMEHKEYNLIKHCFGVCQKDFKLHEFIKACDEMMWHSFIEDYFDTLDKINNGEKKDED